MIFEGIEILANEVTQDNDGEQIHNFTMMIPGRQVDFSVKGSLTFEKFEIIFRRHFLGLKNANAFDNHGDLN